MKIRLAANMISDSIVDGPGLRSVIWTQGCSHNCKGCHNPNTHSFTAGVMVDIEEVKQQILDTKNQDGITLSGGDPLMQIDAVLEIAKFAKSIGLNIWVYTGFTYDQIITMSKSNKNYLEFLKNIDILVDGKFVLEEKTFSLKFRGSKNQRIIDVKKSLESSNVILALEYYKQDDYSYKKPEYIFV